MNRKRIFAVLAAIMLVGVVGVAYAATDVQGDAPDPELSEEEARSIAADHVGGTAQNVALEQEDGPVYEVTVELDDGTTKEVEVDGMSGEVLEVENADEGEDGFLPFDD